MVYIWDTHTRALMYKLPGHAGSVNEVVFHPKVGQPRVQCAGVWGPARPSMVWVGYSAVLGWAGLV